MDGCVAAALGTGLVGAAGACGFLRKKGLHRWLWSYLAKSSTRRAPEPGRPMHLLLCVADHFEPKLGGVVPAVAAQRVQRWVAEYPKLFDRFRDSDGRPPRHSFF